MFHGGGGMNGWGMPGFGSWIFMLLFWGLIIVCIILFVRRLIYENRSNREQPHKQSPLEILKVRYARGEIDREEFERMKKDLK